MTRGEGHIDQRGGAHCQSTFSHSIPCAAECSRYICIAEDGVAGQPDCKYFWYGTHVALVVVPARHMAR